MLVVIKKPKVGQYLVKDNEKIEVLEVWGFYECIQLEREADKKVVYGQLKNDLGENYRDLYFEVYGRVLRGKPEEHKRWENIVLDWKQVQNYTLV